MWSCPGNVTKYYPGLRDILPNPKIAGRKFHNHLKTPPLIIDFSKFFPVK